MRTTLIIDDQVMKKLKALAARRGTKLSSLVESFLRKGLKEASAVKHRPPAKIPTFRMGKAKVNVADRDELYRVMEGPS